MRRLVATVAREHVPLLVQARRLLHVSQGSLGEMLGSSRRTGQRWETWGSYPSPTQWQELARRIHPHDADLAEALAAQGGSSLLDLGLVAPPPPPPAPPPPPPIGEMIDAVVCAAAEAIDVMPRAVR